MEPGEMCSVGIRSRWKRRATTADEGEAMVLLELEKHLVPVEAHDSPARGPGTRQSKRSERADSADKSC
jgi:hypothetical protein